MTCSSGTLGWEKLTACQVFEITCNMDQNRLYFQGEFPCKVCQHPKKGRILVATRNISPGEVIFRERPLIAGPAKPKGDESICLVCYKAVPDSDKWICSPACEEEHQLMVPERKLLEANCPTSFLYESILVLRCLHLKVFDVDLWNYINTFDDHGKELADDPEHTLEIQGIVANIRQLWQRSTDSEEDIRKIYGVLYTNALEYLPHSGDANSMAKALFPITSFASHDCVNNTFRQRKWTVNGNIPEMETRAKVAISSGEEISLHYSAGLKGRFERRKILWDGWFFKCQCPRCSSPSELGSHLSTLSCSECGNGNTIPEIDAKGDSLLDVHTYKCDACDQMTSEEEVRTIEQKLTGTIESTYANDIEGLERIIQDYEGQFHPQHYLMLIVKWLLINLLGRKPGFLNSELSQTRIQSKINYCSDYLRALDIIDPGISHNRGKTLWELYSVKVFQVQKAFDDGSKSKDEFKTELREVKQILAQVQDCLGYSEEGTFEWRILELSTRAQSSVTEILSFLV